MPLCLYSNGILMFGGPFRPYSDPVTQVSGLCRMLYDEQVEQLAPGLQEAGSYICT